MEGVPFLLRGRAWGRSLPVCRTNRTSLITPRVVYTFISTYIYYKCYEFYLVPMMKDKKFFLDKLINFSVYDFGSFKITPICAHAFGPFTLHCKLILCLFAIRALSVL